MNEICDGDDRKLTLGEIANRYGASIISLMLDIQQSRIPNAKLLEFIEDLECFQLDARKFPFSLRRCKINALEKHDYVALSYTWEPSKYEDPSSGYYNVQTRDRYGFYLSPVRNCVFERIFKYMNSVQVDLLWIDRHSIKQRCCKNPICHHDLCENKRDGLGAMDIVYRRSNYPVGLLARPFTSSDDLELLYKILTGELVDRGATPLEDTNTLRVLKEILSDPWWDRGWIFQEQYFSGKGMHLLIPCPSLSMYQGCRYARVFGNIDGELGINYVKFSYQATRFCLVFQNKYPGQDEDAVSHILEKVRRYTAFLDNNESMTPSIISDIWRRSFKDPFDSLAVVANCCQYSHRLDVYELKHKRHSLSLSMLAMCFLNGEIFRNENTSGPLSRMTVSEFLQEQSFKGYLTPSLSFNKECRFIDPWITPEGLVTEGHLWKLGMRVTVQTREDRWVQLLSLADELGDRPLAWQLRDYVRVEKERQFRPGTFARSYMQMMTENIINAINDGKSLRLGTLWDPHNRSPYRAIFISDNIDSAIPGQAQTETRYVFTASRPESQHCDYDTNDLDRHVSIGVDFLEDSCDPVLRLYVRNWVFGLCFFQGCERREVVFPWSQALEDIAPGQM